MKTIALLPLLIGASLAFADAGSASRQAQLEMALVRVQQEQQAVYQQFQMVQELQRREVQSGYTLTAPNLSSGLESQPFVDYDANVRQQRERQQRIEQANRDLNALYARYAELAAQRKALLDQIVGLATRSKD